MDKYLLSTNDMSKAVAQISHLLTSVVESFNEFNESQYEIYSLESTEFGDISHEEYNRIDYTNSFQSAIDKLIENNDYA